MLGAVYTYIDEYWEIWGFKSLLTSPYKGWDNRMGVYKGWDERMGICKGRNK